MSTIFENKLLRRRFFQGLFLLGFAFLFMGAGNITSELLDDTSELRYVDETSVWRENAVLETDPSRREGWSRLASDHPELFLKAVSCSYGTKKRSGSGHE